MVVGGKGDYIRGNLKISNDRIEKVVSYDYVVYYK